MRQPTHLLSSISLIAITNVLVLLLAAGVAAQKTPSPEQYRDMVIEDLKLQKMVADSVGAAVPVAGYGAGVADFLLIPVTAKGKLVAVYRNDAERKAVTQIASALVLRSVQASLFERKGAIEVFSGIKIKDPNPKLISCGPFSLFGALGAGWIQRTGESFVLLALNGRIVNEAEVAELFPDRLDLLKSIAQKLTPTPEDATPSGE